jgi:GNAT superfamily N-acetyltransferase
MTWTDKALGMRDRGKADVRWAESEAEVVELGAFFARNAVKLPEYISHGEIQCELSRDGVSWDVKAAKSISAHFEQLSQDRLHALVAGAWIEGRGPVAVAVVEIVERGKLKYAILEDLLVEEGSRLKGIGERMVRFIETEMRSRRVDWLFLESGVRNERAHRFFEHLQYRQTSKVFAKRFSRRSRA